MVPQQLRIDVEPALSGAKMVLAFSGWMDGGDVSTGTVKRLVERLGAKPFAQIEPESFYIYSFPGAMEVTAMFRPHIVIREGLIKAFEPPANTFYYDQGRNLVFLVGKEPNLNWQSFGDCIFALASRIGVSEIFFVGSFGGAVPHTREPRLYVTVSDTHLRPIMQKCGVRLTNYEGPGSFTTFLMTQAEQRGCDMASVVAEIPGYLQGTNPLSIEAVTRKLAVILGLSIDLTELRGASNEWESRVSEAVEKNPDLAKQVRKLEESYDDDLIGTPTDAPPDPPSADGTEPA